MSESQCVPRPFRVFSALVLALGLSVFVISWVVQPAEASVQLLVLLAAALFAENFAYALPEYSVSLAYPLTIAAIAMFGPAATGLVAALVSTNFAEIHGRQKSASVILFNVGQLVLIATLGAWTYVELGGRVLADSGFAPWSLSEFPALLVPMVAVAAVCGIGNLLLLATASAILRSEPVGHLMLGMLAFVPTQFALAFVGFLVAQVFAINILALPLFIAPLVVARQLYQRYAGLKQAFVSTVRSLVGALEAKDPYTRGHSERVAQYAASLSKAMRLSPRETERLEYAALLHDLGKLAVPSEILVKPGRLETQEMALIREHPGRGSEMIARIPPLRDLAEAVAQHHEWFDGSGYPSRIDGRDLALAARILAVADCFDAMTTTRSYRPALSREQAVAELIAGAGSQFDPEIVRIFIDSRIGLTVVDSPESSSVGGRAHSEPVGLGVDL